MKAPYFVKYAFAVVCQGIDRLALVKCDEKIELAKSGIFHVDSSPSTRMGHSFFIHCHLTQEEKDAVVAQLEASREIIEKRLNRRVRQYGL